MDNALLRCPFCGGKGHVSEETKEESGTIMCGHIVWCGGCNCSTELFAEQYDAINAWNTRTTPEEITTALSRLAEFDAAERDGVLVKLPIKPGDDIYWIDDENKVRVHKSGVRGVTFTKDGFKIVDTDGCTDTPGTQYCYLTKADALAAGGR